MEWNENLSVAEVTLIPLIVAVVGVLKRLSRHLVRWATKGEKENLHEDFWFALALVMGVVTQVAYYFVFVGRPVDGVAWFTLVVLGVAFGLAAGKSYDETKARIINGR